MAQAETASKKNTHDGKIVMPPGNERALYLTNWSQTCLYIGLFILLVIAFILNWKATLFWVNAIIAAFYVILTIYKAIVIHFSKTEGHQFVITPEEIAALKDEDLPKYTILIPLFREADVFEHLIESLSRIDYPKDKLQILLLLEENDTETIEACKKMQPGPPFHPVVVQDSYPRTKPKACDVALSRATGDYLVIYDAEDRPDPDQLKKAVIAFRKCSEEVICIQAKLNFYNPGQNLLSKWFTVDYSTWFDLYLPGLARLDAPIPLGGTSNHFNRRKLVEVGAWDPYNVAEDCDLGMRLYRRGYRTRMLDSTTWEEACSHFGFWIRQRSRWIKGYIQTFFVHTRRPIQGMRDLGFKRYIDFLALTGGMFLTYLVNPVYWLLTLVWIIFRPEVVGEYFPATIFLMGFFCLFIGNFILVYTSMLGVCRRKYFHLVKYALLIPPYWAMVSIAAWKAAWQLIVKPHYWEKTRHGVNVKRSAQAN
ncbi:MAG: glycosyltransferase family 2 protein [Candidatus Sumerlaeia bacterium]